VALVAFGLAVTAACSGLLAFLLLGKDRAPVIAVVGPSEAREGEHWTTRQLREYLQGRGLNFRMRPHRAGALFIDAAYPPGVGDARIARAADAGRYDGRYLLVERRRSAAEAREAAEAEGPGAASWGRFYLRGPGELLAEVLTAVR
jgi:hypothetical protein